MKAKKKNSLIELAYAIGAHWNYLNEGITLMRQFQCLPTTHVTEIKEIYFEIYTKQVSCQFALPLLHISKCQSVLKYLSICQIVIPTLF